MNIEAISLKEIKKSLKIKVGIKRKEERNTLVFVLMADL